MRLRAVFVPRGESSRFKVMYDSFHAHIKRMRSLFDWQKAESREPEH